jgi:hypothetical protein
VNNSHPFVLDEYEEWLSDRDNTDYKVGRIESMKRSTFTEGMKRMINSLSPISTRSRTTRDDSGSPMDIKYLTFETILNGESTTCEIAEPNSTYW